MDGRGRLKLEFHGGKCRRSCVDLSLLQMGNPWTGPPLIRSDCVSSVGRGAWSAYRIHLQITDPAAVCRWQLLRCAAEICLTPSSIPTNQPWEKIETAGGSCARSADPRLVPGNCVCLHRLVCPSVSVLSLLYSPA